MKCNISYKKKTDELLLFVLDKLPCNIKYKILDFLDSHPYKLINEIRIHKNSNLTLIADAKNVKTDIFIYDTDIDNVLEEICDKSIYAHINTIKNGYISIGRGVRAGVCGRANIEKGEICGVSDISSINIRIPQQINDASKYLFSILKENKFKKSVLIYSPPGVGKTTILRDLINKLSLLSPPIRYSVIDTRDEITSFLSKEATADVFISYPKGVAIELATKSMTPQLIICDEISSKEESFDVLCSINSGVKLIATAHASSFEELMSKNILKELFNNNVFDFALGVEREYGERSYKFTLNEL